MLTLSRTQFVSLWLLLIAGACIAATLSISHEFQNEQNLDRTQTTLERDFLDREQMQASARQIRTMLNSPDDMVDAVIDETLPVVTSEPVEGPNISAIVFDQGRAQIIVVQNDGYEKLAVGELWNDWTISAIEPTRVEMIRNGERFNFAPFSTLPNDRDAAN